MKAMLSLIAVKTSSLAIIGYALLYLYFLGGLEQVGSYSAVTALTAPVGMFCSFRYIEWISLSSNKNDAFLVAYLSAVLVYVPVAIIFLFLIYISSEHFPLAMLIFLYKPIEMLSDFYISKLSSEGRNRRALFSSVLKFLCVVIISLVVFVFCSLNAVFAVVISLIISYLAIIILYDIPDFRLHGWSNINRGGVFSYIISQYKYGLLNAMISFNSVAPRYFLAYVGDMRLLGIFTLIYQVSASLVNVLQYPISIKANLVGRTVVLHKRFIALVLLTLFLAALMLFLTPHFSTFMPNLQSQRELILFSVFSFMLMTLILLARGIVFTAAISMSVGITTYRYVALGLFFGGSVILASILGRFDNVLHISIFYVCLSSYVAALASLRTLPGMGGS